MTKLEQRLQSATSDLNRHVREFQVPRMELSTPPRRLRKPALAIATAVACTAALIAIALIAPFGPESPVADDPVLPLSSTPDDAIEPAAAVPTYVWTRVDDPDLGGEGNQTIYSIRLVSSGLVAVGEDGYSPAVWRSHDGLDWKRVTDATDAFGSEHSPYGEGSRRWLLDVAQGGGRLVAVGIDVLHRPGESHIELDPAVKVMAFWYSDDDGSTWTRVPHDGGEFLLGSGPLRSDVHVMVTPAGFLAVGDGIWTSLDGMSWKRADAPGAYVSDAITTDTAILAVGAAGPNGDREYREAAWYSTDGMVWQSAGVETSPTFQGKFAAIAETADGYLALGSGSRRLVWFSPDGFTWTYRGGYEENDGYRADQAYDITAIGDTVVAVGAREAYLATAATVWESTDGGFTWTVREDQDVFGNPRSESRQSGAFSIVKFEDHLIVGGSFGNNLAQRGLLEGNGDAAVWVGTPTDY